MQENKYDVIIIGAGPIGLTCGIEAQRKKLNYLIIEKGCIVNSIFNYPVNMTFFSTSERLEIGNVPFISHGVKPTRSEALEYYRRVAQSFNLKINLYEEVNGLIKIDEGFALTTSKKKYYAEKIIISTGFYDCPNYMNIPGEELKKVKHYYTEPHLYASRKVVIIGGGNSGVDAALETFRCGADVTMIIKKDELESGVKYWVRPDIENRINEGSIKAFFNSTIVKIEENKIELNTPEGKIEIENDFVLALTGYHSDFSFLEKVGVNIDENKTPVYDDETFESNIKGIYLAGVVCGGMNTGKWFIENARSHAENIFKNF